MVRDLFEINDSNWSKGFQSIYNHLLLKEVDFTNKYFYVNIWSITCQPCIDEIPIIESMVHSFNKKVVNLMVTSHSELIVDKFLQKNDISINNFILLNGKKDFISGIYNSIGVKNQIFPLHAILNNKGMPEAYLFGAFSDKSNSNPIINFINSSW